MKIKLQKINQIALGGAFFFLTFLLFFLSWNHFRPTSPTPSTTIHQPDLSISPKSPPPTVPPPTLKEHLEKPSLSSSSPTRENLQKEIDAVAAGIQQKAPPEALRDLAESGKYLQKNVSANAIDQMAEKLPLWQELPERATEPEFLPPEGDFDFETAQVHDVERFHDRDGQYRYSVLLFDAQGRTFRTEMAGAEGESLWKTMQLIKKNPLMEKVYRTLVIPLLDEMIRQEKKASINGEHVPPSI